MEEQTRIREVLQDQKNTEPTYHENILKCKRKN